MKQSVTLPYPPGVNAWLRYVGGRPILSVRARDFKERAALLARAGGLCPLSGEVAVWLSLYRPRRSGDIDGPLKLLLDSLEGVAYFRDSQIVRLTVDRFDDKHNPRVEVVVLPAHPDAEVFREDERCSR